MAKTATTEKIDLYKTHKAEYAALREPALVTMKAAKYLAADGTGEPGGEFFQAALAALYQVAYTVKMTKKFSGGPDYKVCALEGLWWCEDPAKWEETPKNAWRWTLLIRVPNFITARDLKDAVTAIRDKGKDTALAAKVRLETLTEGKCVQVLHVGPYSAEKETIARMHSFAEANGLAFHGRHHEIYLSDPRRVPPERLKTILRMPVE